MREVEEQDLPFEEVRRKYNILGSCTVQKWVRKYDNGTRGKRVRVEKPEEISELRRLRERVPMPTLMRPWSGPIRNWLASGPG